MSASGTGEPDFTDPTPAAPKRTPKNTTPAPKPKVNPGGSTSRVRTDLLRALGVLKIVNGDQMWRLLRPGAQENKFARAGLNDLDKAGLVISEGKTEGALKTWRLTPAGAVAAEQVLPTGRKVGSLAKGAGVHGAGHAMSVNDTIVAFVRGAKEPEGAGAIGAITSWHTEYPIEMRAGAKVRPDAVLRAPEIGLPVLLVEVDRYTENRPVLAAKFPKYAAVFAHRVKVPDPASRSGSTTTVAAWTQLFPDPVHAGYPPVAVVFADNASETVTRNRIKALEEATREQWQGDASNRAYTDYSRAIPILATSLVQLQQEGPQGAIWQRFGHTGLQTLADALTNPDDADAYWSRREARERAQAAAQREAERRKQQRAAREASRCPVCRRAADEFDNAFDASDGTTACRPCVRDQEQADLAAAVQDLHTRAADATLLLAWSTVVTPAWGVLAYEARLRARIEYAAWRTRRAARLDPPPAPEPQPDPEQQQWGALGHPPVTELQRLLAQLPPADELKSQQDASGSPMAPNRVRLQRSAGGGRTPEAPAVAADDGWS